MSTSWSKPWSGRCCSMSVARRPTARSAMALNVSSPSSDAGAMYRYFAAVNAAPKGFNFPQWKDAKFEEAMGKLAESSDEATYTKYYAMAHERLVDNPPWL